MKRLKNWLIKKLGAVDRRQVQIAARAIREQAQHDANMVRIRENLRPPRGATNRQGQAF